MTTANKLASLGNSPAFSAVLSTNQTLTTGTYTKMAFATEEFDTNSNFDTSTYRFTPKVAGYYQVNGACALTSQFGIGQSFITVYKNGAKFKTGTDANIAGPISHVISTLIYLNGTTDYIEAYAYQGSGGSLTIASSAPDTYFQASMTRGA